MKTREHGFTLIEVVMASVVTVIMMLALFATFDVGQDVCTVGSANLANQVTNTSAMDSITRALKGAKIKDIDYADMTDHGTWVEFRTPAVNAANEFVVDAENHPVFGAEFNGAWQPNWYYRYQFTTSGKTFNEYRQGLPNVDLNGDGSMSGSFDVGRIDLITYQADGTERQRRSVTSDSILMSQNGLGDLNGDGIGDPLFMRMGDAGVESPDGRYVKISLYALKEADAYRRAFTHAISTVGTRNVYDY